MPLTELDPTAALVVIDLQKGIAASPAPAVHPASEIVRRAAQLARAFRERELPVMLVTVTGTAPGRTDAGPRGLALPADWAELVPELERHPDDFLVTKQRLGAFIGTSLDAYLRQRGVTQLFLECVLQRCCCFQRDRQSMALMTWLAGHLKMRSIFEYLRSNGAVPCGRGKAHPCQVRSP